MTELDTPDDTPDDIQSNWNSGSEWNSHDYATVPIPNDRPKKHWEPDERRAYLLDKLQEYGTWRNVPMHQNEVAEDFDVSQQAISQDLKELRKYIRFHAGDRAVSMTELVAQRAVAELQEDEDWFKALQAQLDYNEWLFELGRLDRAPDKKQVHNINEKISDDSLSAEEQEHFADLSEKLQQAQDAPIDVDFEEVEADE